MTTLQRKPKNPIAPVEPATPVTRTLSSSFCWANVVAASTSPFTTSVK